MSAAFFQGQMVREVLFTKETIMWTKPPHVWEVLSCDSKLVNAKNISPITQGWSPVCVDLTYFEPIDPLLEAVIRANYFKEQSE